MISFVIDQLTARSPPGWGIVRVLVAAIRIEGTQYGVIDGLLVHAGRQDGALIGRCHNLYVVGRLPAVVARRAGETLDAYVRVRVRAIGLPRCLRVL